MLYKFEINFKKQVPAEKELIECILAGMGIKANDIIEESGTSGSRIYFFLERKKQAEALKEKFRKALIKRCRIKISSLKKKDWQDKWKEDYKPFKITKTIRIVPAWMRNTKNWDEAKTVFLNIGMVFGSGLHATTRFTAQFIEEKSGKIGSFLDIGTGSGILAVIAAKLGISKIWGIDIDHEAAKTARKNMKANGCRDGHFKTTDMNGFNARGEFDFVAANLRTKILIDNKKKIIARVRKGKYLAVSGVSLVNYKEFREKFDSENLRCLRVKKDKDWTAVLYKKI